MPRATGLLPRRGDRAPAHERERRQPCLPCRSTARLRGGVRARNGLPPPGGRRGRRWRSSLLDYPLRIDRLEGLHSRMPLSDIEVRILGSLIEKEATTPDNYPLSLNALTAACNQISNRDPVMELGEDTVKYAVNNLRQQSLVRAIQPSDSRVMKFQHLAADKWNLDEGTGAVLCVLMLRGPQTLGEIKGRAGRLAEFPNIEGVEGAMRDLISRELAVELPRRPGQKEVRYTHLL